jgi:hypothetical protein
MSRDPKSTNTGHELENPASHFKTPNDVANDKKLSHGDEEALNAWEQDARQLLTASDEGMTARSDEGDKRDAVYLDDVVRAKEIIAERLRLKNKPFH